jgi:dihydrofolate reductase
VGKIVVSTYVTLDGVIENPQNWSLRYFDEEAGAFASDLLFGADALLLGRKTYESFVESWPPRSGEFADRINAMPKQVVSTTLSGPLEWNASLVEGDPVEGIARLREQQDLLVYGSGRLARTLLEHGLLDVHHLWVIPVVWGSGARLLDDARETAVGPLLDARRLPSGTVIMSYGPPAAG